MEFLRLAVADEDRLTWVSRPGPGEDCRCRKSCRSRPAELGDNKDSLVTRGERRRSHVRPATRRDRISGPGESVNCRRASPLTALIQMSGGPFSLPRPRRMRPDFRLAKGCGAPLLSRVTSVSTSTWTCSGRRSAPGNHESPSRQTPPGRWMQPRDSDADFERRCPERLRLAESASAAGRRFRSNRGT